MRDLNKINLKKGKHKQGTDLCVMEAVAYFAGEKHTDKPECACPAVTAFTISLNDSCNDEQRQKLKPLIPLIAGTNDGRELERAKLFTWAAIKKFAPTALRKADLKEHAIKLENAKTLSEAESAGAAAWAAARAAVEAAARAAARAAAEAAARAAVEAAAEAAEVAAWAAAEADCFDLALDTLIEAIMLGRPSVSELIAEIEQTKKFLPHEPEFGKQAIEIAKERFVYKLEGE